MHIHISAYSSLHVCPFVYAANTKKLRANATERLLYTAVYTGYLKALCQCLYSSTVYVMVHYIL